MNASIQGHLIPAKTLILRQAVGEITNNETGRKYELTAIIPGNCPLVRSKHTGRFFSLDWEDILGMAIAAGIDQPEERVTP